MSFFKCTICGDSHKLITLLEFPQPDIISKITSGQIDSTLDLITKNSFLINKETFVIQFLLSLPITDFEDTFDLMVWGEISAEELLPKLGKMKASKAEKVNIIVSLIGSIPFFSGTENLVMEIQADYKEEDHLFSVVEIEKNIELKKILKNGISKKELAKILSPLYH
jgi:hypothetical protein